MAKNRTQYEEEAKDLGIDFSGFETNAEFSEAIAAKKAEDAGDGEEAEGNEGDRPVNTDTDLENPTDDQADVEAPMDPENPTAGKKGKKGKKAEGFVLKTTKEVSFIINGVRSEGTVFEFESEDELAARKQLLVERYGAGVIEE